MEKTENTHVFSQKLPLFLKKKITPFYKKNTYGLFIKKIKPPISAFIKKSIVLKNRDAWASYYWPDTDWGDIQ